MGFHMLILYLLLNFLCGLFLLTFLFLYLITYCRVACCLVSIHGPYIYLNLQTVDQFFGLNLLMDITHLQALLSVIFHSLDAYLLKMLNQLGKVQLSWNIFEIGHIAFCFTSLTFA